MVAPPRRLGRSVLAALTRSPQSKDVANLKWPELLGIQGGGTDRLRHSGAPGWSARSDPDRPGVRGAARHCVGMDAHGRLRAPPLGGKRGNSRVYPDRFRLPQVTEHVLTWLERRRPG